MSTAGRKYVLVTAAYNEEADIERTIQSVIGQTLPPQRWVIVSDCSTDRTDQIVQSYAATHPFIQLVRIQEPHPRNFVAQVLAINLGCKHLQSLDYQFIANVDADVSFEPTYYAQLLEKFDLDPKLGLAGGFIFEKRDGKFQSRPTNSKQAVAHAVQMFRRECFESVGGYLPLPYGGPDTHAQVKARMQGWHVEAFPEFPVFHYRPTGSAAPPMRNLFRQGRMDYSLGWYPPYEIVKVVSRMLGKPYVVGSLASLSGFLWGYCRREKRAVSADFVRFVRMEQMNRLRNFFFRLPPRYDAEQGRLKRAS